MARYRHTGCKNLKKFVNWITICYLSFMNDRHTHTHTDTHYHTHVHNNLGNKENSEEIKELKNILKRVEQNQVTLALQANENAQKILKAISDPSTARIEALAKELDTSNADLQKVINETNDVLNKKS